MRKKLPPPKPFKPFVTMEQVFEYDASRNENPTPSRFVNAVMEAIQVHKMRSSGEVGCYLGITALQLNGALEVALGKDFFGLYSTWLEWKIERLKEEHPDWNTETLAHALGYANRASLWNITHREERKKRKEETMRRNRWRQ